MAKLTELEQLIVPDPNLYGAWKTLEKPYRQVFGDWGGAELYWQGVEAARWWDYSADGINDRRNRDQVAKDAIAMDTIFHSTLVLADQAPISWDYGIVSACLDLAGVSSVQEFLRKTGVIDKETAVSRVSVSTHFKTLPSMHSIVGLEHPDNKLGQNPHLNYSLWNHGRRFGGNSYPIPSLRTELFSSPGYWCGEADSKVVDQAQAEMEAMKIRGDGFEEWKPETYNPKMRKHMRRMPRGHSWDPYRTLPHLEFFQLIAEAIEAEEIVDRFHGRERGERLADFDINDYREAIDKGNGRIVICA